MKFVIPLLLSLIAPSAWSQHETVDPHAIPWSTIAVEFLNVALLVGLLIYLLRKAVVEHFKGRLKAYTELVERAENARAAAEKSHREISKRLQNLQTSADQSLKQAHADAEELKKKLIAESQLMAQKLEEESKRTVQFEIEKAKNELRLELLRVSIESSREALQKCGTSEQKRLQTEFVDKIQVVGQ